MTDLGIFWLIYGLGMLVLSLIVWWFDLFNDESGRNELIILIVSGWPLTFPSIFIGYIINKCIIRPLRRFKQAIRPPKKTLIVEPIINTESSDIFLKEAYKELEEEGHGNLL